MKKDTTSLTTALQQSAVLASSRTFTGIKLPDRNTSGRFMLVESDQVAYSFRLADIEDELSVEAGRTRVRLRARSIGYVIRPFMIQDGPSLLVDDNLTSPPPVRSRRGDPRFATAKDTARIQALKPAARTLASVAANWKNSCELGDSEDNNCAHYLSDAFIRAGYAELRKDGQQSEINEWCDWNDTPKNNAARPIRAKEMWEWFKNMSQTSQTTKPSKKGMWAVFQWDKSYSGGHVLVYDSDSDVVYGRGAYWDWSSQNFYQW